MKVKETKLKDCLLIEPEIFGDERGFFYEGFHSTRYKEEAGIDFSFVQDNFSRSSKGVLRGMHFQVTKPQGKLVSVISGEVFDVAVDIRKDSPKFGQWEGYELSAENGHQLYIPIGFAHGFLTLKPNSEIVYKCTDYYAPNSEGSLRWNDPTIGIKWPLLETPIINARDTAAPLFKEFKTPFRFGENS